MPSFADHDVVYDDGNKTLHYISAGPDNGELLIFIHGWPGIGKTWHRQLTEFASKGFKVVAPDMPGYGKSTSRKVKSDYAQKHIVTAMLALLKDLKRDQAVWVAHDWGCGTLWSLARTHPEVCKAVSAMTIPYATIELGLEELLKYVNRDMYPVEEYPWGQWAYQAFYEQSFDKATEWFDKDIRGFIKVAFTKGDPRGVGKPPMMANVMKDGGWMGGAERPPPASHIPDEISCIDQETYEEVVAAMEKTGFYAADAWYANHAANREFTLKNTKNNSRLSMPVLFIEAKYDTICDTVNSRLGEAQEKLCDDLTFVSIDAGHFVPLEKAQEVNEAIADWLKKKVYHSSS